MFRQEVSKSKARTALGLLELIYHATVRQVRKTHGNAIIGLLTNILQIVILIVVFYIMMSLLGMRSNALRGDFVLYIMSGIFLFMTHNKAMGAVSGSEGPTSPMMKHAPMNTIIAICASAFSSLYLQILAAAVVLFVYHVAFTPITIEEPVMALAMLLLAWFSGVGIGVIFLAAKPWWPGGIAIISQIYMRANMIASGKMFVANQMPTSRLKLFDWNPLFHTIDQSRGFIFLNYNPHYSSITYPIYVSLACLMIGLMAETFTRKHASLSWSAKS